MPGYLRGFVERGYELDEDKMKWELISRTDPLFHASQSTFKYVVLGKRYFDPFPFTEGFPEDISKGAKAIIGDPKPEETIEEAYEGSTENGSPVKRRRVVEMSDMRDMDWEERVSDDWVEYLKNEVPDRDYVFPAAARSFKLLDSEGDRYVEKYSTDIGKDDHWGYLEFIDVDEFMSLVEGESVIHDGIKLQLERKTKREMLPERWFKLLEWVDSVANPDIGVYEARFIFYWHH
jgi:hypothetical protein